jgi:16S rRNA (guanine966-N2)-methyltransferase
VRVLSGSDKGRRIVAPQGSSTRPTTARVRSSTFDMLCARYDIFGAKVLDLFAGSGALGLEALSRGASTATFVEWSSKASKVLRENIFRLGVQDRARVVRLDALEYLQRMSDDEKDQYDLVFCDPPYRFSEWGVLLMSAPRSAILLLESDREIEAVEGRTVLRSKRYGGSVVTIMSAEEGRGGLS